MKLPNPESAIISINKLSGYCLNFNHSDGQHKARVFQSALGLTIKEVEELRLALLEAIKVYDAILDKHNQYGQKYVVDFPLNRLDKQAIIHSVWIVRNNEDFPRLVTCYVF